MAARVPRSEPQPNMWSEGDVPANILLQTDTSRINVNIESIAGSVSVGNMNTIKYHTTHTRNDDSSSSDSSSDSDTDDFCRRHHIPSAKSIRSQMKRVNVPRAGTFILEGGSKPVVLDRKGIRVNVSGNGNGRSSAGRRTRPPASAGGATPQTSATRAAGESSRPSSQRQPTGQPATQLPGRSPGNSQGRPGQQAGPGMNVPYTARPAGQHFSTPGYTFTQTSHHTVVRTGHLQSTIPSSRTTLEERNAQVASVVGSLPEPYRTVDDRIVRTIVPYFGDGWRRVFRYLGLSDDSIDLTYQEFAQDGIAEVIHNLLQQWLRESSSPYVFVLAEALIRAEQHDIIKHLKHACMAAVAQ